MGLVGHPSKPGVPRTGVSHSTHALAFRRNRVACSVPSLESRIPPPAVVLVIGVFMWLVSRAAPSLHFNVPAHNWLAVVLVLAGFLTGLSGVVTFLRANTTVDPTKPRAITVTAPRPRAVEHGRSSNRPSTLCVATAGTVAGLH